MGLSKGRRGHVPDELEALNEGLPASEAVAIPARGGISYQVAAAGISGDLRDAKVSLGYLHAVNPETGLEVVFVPGEALPAWARAVQESALYPDAPEPQKQPAARRSVKAQMAEGEGKPS